jgi:hypothetical protein
MGAARAETAENQQPTMGSPNMDQSSMVVQLGWACGNALASLPGNGLPGGIGYKMSPRWGLVR